MFITDRINDICLFKLTDKENDVVKQVLTEKTSMSKLESLYEDSLGETRIAIGEIIDLIGYFFKYGDTKIENLVLTP